MVQSLRACGTALVVLAILLPWAGYAVLPNRLVVAFDGISYRDMRSIQEGISYRNGKGDLVYRRAFHEGYFPASRLVSTFPSASDSAWTEILGNRPLRGYQRTHYSKAANALVVVNGLTSSVEFERQMSWRMESGFRLGMSYIKPVNAYEYEVKEIMRSFLEADGTKQEAFYGYIYSTDPAQHMACDVFAIIETLDQALRELRATYRAREGRELEVLVLSDHGNNHAGPGKRVKVRSFLQRAGYAISTSIRGARDVVLPTVGIESWVEINNQPSETERLLQILPDLEGADIITAAHPVRPNEFIVVNSRHERALIHYAPERNAYRYSPQTGDPLEYEQARAALAGKGQLDSAGFASSDAWMEQTMAHRYPLALERIVHAFTRGVLNPATIIISLDNQYVHANWLTKGGSGLISLGGTHGGLDHLNSVGMVVSSFAPTVDTSASRIAALYGGFPGMRNYRAVESGAEFVASEVQVQTPVRRFPLDEALAGLPRGEVYLRIWSPSLTRLGPESLLEVTIKRAARYVTPPIRRGDPDGVADSARRLTLRGPLRLREDYIQERVYRFPADLGLEPRKLYRMAGQLRSGNETARIFDLFFYTDIRGQPVAY